MDFRLHEVHPMLVHYPLALLPLSVGADLLGKLTGNSKLEEVGRQTIGLAAASGAAAGLAGLVAQEEIDLDDEQAHHRLTTHRNMNLGLVAGSAVMALWRRRRSKPSAGYIAAGLGSLAAMTYSAYLGGKLVYNHGAGVERARGVLEDASPKFRRGSTGEIFRQTGRHLKEGATHAFEHLQEGDIAPTLRRPSPRP